MRLPASMTLAALLIATPALAEPVDLRGPAPEAGRTLVTTVKTETEMGQLNMAVQGQAIPGQMQTTSDQVIEVKILEVDQGTPTKVESTFVKSKSVTTMNVFGQQQKEEDTNMQGVVMTQTKSDDGWDTEVKGGNFPAEAKDMLKNAGYFDPRLSFPEEKVSVGDTWKIEDDEVGAMLGQAGIPGAKFEGDIEFKLTEIKQVDGVNIAIITYEMDSAILMDMTQQGMQVDIRIDMDGKGTIERNLTDYTSDSEFEGDMDMDTEMSANGQQMMKMTAKMPVKTTSKEALK